MIFGSVAYKNASGASKQKLGSNEMLRRNISLRKKKRQLQRRKSVAALEVCIYMFDCIYKISNAREK